MIIADCIAEHEKVIEILFEAVETEILSKKNRRKMAVYAGSNTFGPVSQDWIYPLKI